MTNDTDAVLDAEPEAALVLVTFPDDATARGVARRLVEDRHVACVNLVPGVTSVYRWEDAVQEDGEVLALLKTTVEAVPGLEAALLALHPYDTPEFVVVAPRHVEARYRAWLTGAVGARPIGSSEPGAGREPRSEA